MIRRRGRRRKSEMVNFSIDTKEEHNVTFNTNQVNDVNDRDKNNISFGNMNIVIHSLKDEPFEPIVTNNIISLNSSSSIEKKASSLAVVSSQRCLIRPIEEVKYPDIQNISIQTEQKQLINVSNNIITTLPNKTDIYCWWCCHQFDNPPCYATIKYDDMRDRFNIRGNFCSWNCSKSYILSQSDTTKYRKCEYLSYLYLRLNKKHNIIKCAPPREKLKMFGGNMNIEEFRNGYDTSYTDLNPSCGLIKIIDNYEEKRLQKFRKISSL
tara:strand:- start:228 stop:1028 length:801 start_codon:yes stop_codon:yes gene_type:complete